MKLEALIDGLPVQVKHDSGHLDITCMVDDSRRVQPGALFVVRNGTQGNGASFVRDAVERGAVAILADHSMPLPGQIACLVAADVMATALAMADRLHDDPLKSLTLLGVTGTNGKSTTVWLIQQMLNLAGLRCGLVSTTRIDDGSTPREATNTTPGALELRSTLGAMYRAGCTHAAVEVSSHGIDQGRVRGLDFAAAVFTNLSGDHLDYHKTMASYADAKAKLFAGLGPRATAVVNLDDEASERMLRDCRARVLRCSMRDAQSDCVAEIVDRSVHGARVQMHGPWGELDVVTPLIGAHNVMNALQAAAACHAIGASREAIQRALEQAEAPPGRLEVVTTDDVPFTVLVDYSHTDGALDTVLSELRPLVPQGGQLRTLFGCGGDRDRTKRPRMAAAALRHSDEVVITSDNPRTEDPLAIIDQILAGVPAARRDDVIIEADRAAAIEIAVERCRPGDVLVIAGKGHETYQIVGAITRPFDDRVVARDAVGRHGVRVASP